MAWEKNWDLSLIMNFMVLMDKNKLLLLAVAKGYQEEELQALPW